MQDGWASLEADPCERTLTQANARGDGVFVGTGGDELPKERCDVRIMTDDEDVFVRCALAQQSLKLCVGSSRSEAV